jgi:tetratricopeptide (TPR) repeat protein
MNPTPQALSELFTQYVRNQAAAREQGLGFADTAGEVLPHDAAPVQPVDPALAWKDAIAAATGVKHSFRVPPDWPQLVAAQEPAVAIAFALGNFPQLVRNLQTLLTGVNLTRLRDASTRPALLPDLLDWAATVHDFPQKLFAASVLRLARHYDRTAELLGTANDVPAEWRMVWANEEAALLWHRGRHEEAAKKWQALEPTTPVLFNSGMAALFLGRAADAHAALTQATALLPETHAWHHLGRLYLALADARR